MSNFWRTLEIPLINYEINLILTWPEKFVISGDNGAIIFAITDTKISIVTPSSQDNIKLLKLLKPRFKSKINWNKCQSKATTQNETNI